jgi:hypothetical protein
MGPKQSQPLEKEVSELKHPKLKQFKLIHEGEEEQMQVNFPITN